MLTAVGTGEIHHKAGVSASCSQSSLAQLEEEQTQLGGLALRICSVSIVLSNMLKAHH